MDILCKASAIDAHYDEGVGQEAIRLLEGAHVSVPGGWSVCLVVLGFGWSGRNERPRARSACA